MRTNAIPRAGMHIQAASSTDLRAKVSKAGHGDARAMDVAMAPIACVICTCDAVRFSGELKRQQALCTLYTFGERAQRRNKRDAC